MKKINIAIDGYSSCGKSTLAKALSHELHYKYVDTGSMYRALALFAARNNMCDPEGNPDLDQLELALPAIDVEFHINPATKKSEAYLNDEPVEHHIRTIEISNLASRISKNRSVRNKLQAVQKLMASRKGVIMDGRDIGTVVMPHAELKIFMIADPEIRAVRRYEELKASGKEVSLDAVRKNQAERDHEDTHRAEDPLRKADDAIVLDNSYLSEKEQLQFVMELAGKLAVEADS